MVVKDIETWNRKEHFRFFRSFPEPFFDIVAEVDCTRSYEHHRVTGASFSLRYLHAALTAVNGIEEFRYRIRGNDVVVPETIHLMTTVAREDHTFAFTFIPFHPSLEVFTAGAQQAITAVRAGTGLGGAEHQDRLDVVHCTSLPWIRFSSMTHARDYKKDDSIPKFAFGKCVSENGICRMPVSVHVHHGLVDGYHVGRFLERFEIYMNSSPVQYPG